MKAEKEQDQLKLTLSKEEYLRLIDLVFLGKWVTNSSYGEDPECNPYHEMEQSLFDVSRHLDLPKYFEHYEVHSFFTQKRENQVMKMVDAYDQEALWMTLASLLAQRDVHRAMKSGEPFSGTMMDEVVQREMEYEQEFEEHGLKNVEVKKKKER
jgi:hypothetical protein